MWVPLRLPILCLAVSLFCLLSPLTAYLLNEPRVLLPAHPETSVNFTLKITEPSGGCFTWRSNRPDIATVHPLGPEQCSDSAVVRSVPKALSASHPSTIIFIDEKSSGVHLSCTVQVAEISRVQIETVAKMLYIDADPSRMMLRAYDSEGDVFSSLGELPVEWELRNTAGQRPLRIVSFDKSSYEAPKEIILLEQKKKKGHTILLEGVSTGSATLTAKFADHHFDKIPATSLELTVVASLLLQPAVVYVPPQALVPFTVFIIRQNLIEVVQMPSPDYYLQVADGGVARLNSKENTVRALAYGHTDVHLYSENIKEQSKLGGIRLPSSPFFVVDPDRIEWRVEESSNYLLQRDVEYTLDLNLLTEDGNSMIITDNMLFESFLDDEYFKVVGKSTNQSYFKVIPLKRGKTIVRSKFVSIIDEYGKEVKQSGRVRGEQELLIMDPVRVSPHQVYLPYLPKHRVNFELEATGGTGMYDWSSADSSVCDVDANGHATPFSLGSTTITAFDRRNKHMKDSAQVSVVEITSISFGATRKEAIEGNKLVMNVQLQGETEDGQTVQVTDCRAAHIQARITDDRIARVDTNVKPSLPSEGTGCATFSLSALSSGNTKVTVTFGRFTASTDIAVYPSMQAKPESLGLALNSEFDLLIEGGPRPWIDDTSTHFIDAKSKLVTHSHKGNHLKVTCGKEEGSEKLIVSMGNRVSASLPLPLVIELPLPVCCANPNRLNIARLDRLSTCPGKTDAILVDSKARYVLQGYAQCGTEADRLLDSVSGISVNWKSSDTALLMLNSVAPHEITKQPIADVMTRRKSGTASLSADAKLPQSGKKLHAIREVLVTTPIQVHPDPLLVWNERDSRSEAEIRGGSGHFAIADRHANSLVNTEIKGRTLEVSPLSKGSVGVTLKDLCIEGLQATVSVRVVQIHALSITAPDFVGINDIVDVWIVALDEHGEEIAHKSNVLSNVRLEASNDRATLQRQSPMHYSLRGVTLGSVTLSAFANSSTGQQLISRPKAVQIFAPLHFDPTRLTLIPEAVFQLQVLGGPQPTPPIEFSLNNSAVARVQPNALITSTALGYATITGTLKVGDKQVTKDSVVLRVVSLKGIRLVASSHRLETGGRVHVRVQGIDEEETPFSFGGAIYPLKIEWHVSHDEILSSDAHPIVDGMNADAHNQFALWLQAKRTGKTTIKVRAHLHDKAHRHFAGSSSTFEAYTEIEVVESMQLAAPEVPISTIRISPHSSFQLSLQKWSTTSEKPVFSSSADSSLLSVSASGRLSTHSREGIAAVLVRQTPENRSIIVPVMVSRVHSLHLRLSTESAISADSAHLPVGLTLALNVEARDAFGQLMHVADDAIYYRPHRFDLTDIASSNGNRSLSIHLKLPGETVLKIWLRDHPQVSSFLRLPVAGWIFDDAHRRAYVQSDIACLKSPFAGSVRWTSSSRGIRWLDSALGIAQLTASGEHKISVNEGEQTLDDAINVLEPRHLHFSGQLPSLLTTQPNKEFIFPVKIQAHNGTESALDCTAEQESSLSQVSSSIEVPFVCSFHFSRKPPSQLPAAYWLTANTRFHLIDGYSCVLSRLEVPTEEWKFDMKSPAEVTVEAKWLGSNYKVESASVTLPFHFATVAFEEEIHLSDLDEKPFVLSISAPPYQTGKLTVRGCDLVSISPVKRPEELANAPANVFYAVTLKTKSAALFEEWRSKCNVSVVNQETGQLIEVPIRIRMISDTTSLLEAMSRKSWLDMLFNLFLACVFGILTVLGYRYYKSMTDKAGFVGVSSPLHTSSMLVSSSPNSRSLTRSFPSSADELDNSSLLHSPDSPVFRGLNRNTVGARGDNRLWSDGSKENNNASPYRRRH